MCHQNNIVRNIVQDCVRSNLRRSKNQNFPGEACPQTPLGGTHANACVAVLTHASTTFTITSSPQQKSCMKHCLGFNVSSSAHNCGCMVDGGNIIAAI